MSIYVKNYCTLVHLIYCQYYVGNIEMRYLHFWYTFNWVINKCNLFLQPQNENYKC